MWGCGYRGDFENLLREPFSYVSLRRFLEDHPGIEIDGKDISNPHALTEGQLDEVYVVLFSRTRVG